MLKPGKGGFQEFERKLARALRARVLGRPCLDFALEHIAPQLEQRESLWLEFGVWTGRSLRLLANASQRLRRAPGRLFGFDAFKGLPERWRDAASLFGRDFERKFTEKGSFSLHGQAPRVDNAQLVVGWFNETLPGFLQRQQSPVSFLHVDSDLYSSAKLVLEKVGPRLTQGAVIVFDELLNFVGYRRCEMRALYEWLQSPGFREAGHRALEVLGYRGPELVVGDAALELALRAQGTEGIRYPQDALFRVW